MAAIEYREFCADDADSLLRLHDTAFPAMPADYWHRWLATAPVTAAVATLDGEVVGAVPFLFRDFVPRRGVAVRVAWEYSVCVREDLRDQGVGSGLMRVAKQFLPGRCLAMMVYREDERSLPYGFYRRNGHHDLAYVRPWVRRDAPGAGVGGVGGVDAVGRVDWQAFLGRRDEALALFAQAHGAFGGYPQRHAGYHAQAVGTPQYAEIPLQLSVLERRDASGALLGYAILGEERYEPRLHLLEMATRDGDTAIAVPLLQAFARSAAERGLPAVASLLDSSPYVPALAALGFAPVPRSRAATMLMMHALDPEGLATASWQENGATAALDVVAFTPEREVCLHRAAASPARRVLLEMKEDTLARLVVCRLDLRAAIAQETVTAIGARPVDVDAIARALPFCAWSYQQLDFV